MLHQAISSYDAAFNYSNKITVSHDPALYIDKYRYVGKKYGQAYYYFIAASRANQYPVLLRYLVD